MSQLMIIDTSRLLGLRDEQGMPSAALRLRGRSRNHDVHRTIRKDVFHCESSSLHVHNIARVPLGADADEESICSIMARYSIACRGEAKDVNYELQVKETLVDLFVGEQNSEAYLCNINSNGEVTCHGLFGHVVPVTSAANASIAL